MGLSIGAGLGIFFLLVLWLSYPFASIMVYRNRHVYPVKGRMPRLTIVMNGLLVFFCSHVCWILISPHSYPCALDYWFNSMFSYSGMDLSALRMVRLLFHFEITKNIVELNNAKKNGTLTEWKPNWYLQHRWMMYPKFLYSLIGCLWSFYIIVNILITAANPSWRSLEHCPNLSQGSPIALGWFVLVVTCHFIFAGFLALKLRAHKRDAYSFQLEVFLSVWITIIGFFCYLITIFSGKSSPIVYRCIFCTITFSGIVLAELWPWVASERYKLTAAYRPVALAPSGSYCAPASSSEDSSTVGHGLRDLITNEQGYEMFMDYLKTEFSSENLLFYREVVEFRQLDPNDMDSIRGRAIELYHQFIIEGASFQVNLPSAIAHPLAAKMNRVKNPGEIWEAMELLALFADAQEEIYRLMEGDSFRRFQTTESMQRFVSLNSPPPISPKAASGAGDPPMENFSVEHHSEALADHLTGEIPEFVDMVGIELKSSIVAGSPGGSRGGSPAGSKAGAIDPPSRS